LTVPPDKSAKISGPVLFICHIQAQPLVDFVLGLKVQFHPKRFDILKAWQCMAPAKK